MNTYHLPSSQPATGELPYPATSQNNTLNREVAAADRDAETRSTKFAKYAGAAALYATMYAVSVVASDISQGILDGKERVAHDHSQVHTVYEYASRDPVFSAHATVVLTGLGTKDATGTAETLAVHREVGSVYAIEYGNKDLNTKDIAERIIERATEDDITQLSFDGYSMGGPIALDVATHIHEKAPDIDVVSLVLNSSPVGHDSLTERSAKSIQMMEQVLSLHRDLVYYENGRIAIELAARNEHYLSEVEKDDSRGFVAHSLSEYSFNGTQFRLDIASLRHELSEIRHKLQQPNVADANLINNQANILKLDFDEKIQALSDDTLVVYTRSDIASGDTVVDVEASEDSVVEALSEHNQPYKVLREHIQHANPAERREEYDRMIRGKIQPDVIYYLQGQKDDSDTATTHSVDHAFAHDVVAHSIIEAKERLSN